ncbi:DUF1425 domain-containing protein [Campylobacter helveticus]|uniref:DUF1425 domain-containing protein n=1 Tax=Campylobacter helveticus TaxID=28898 RepID=A0AAX2UJ09_9BACT|nr:YcfL family protein [Campylobacter helveticus]ARE81321.1 putative periplasmic lipoprotein (DUF1425 domain) [Campylobacter helveticus]MCR2038977.1 YcfL family protein [Campylobacter helveticus]MCR2054556.1 YcfL family protein [Campylobacter helveticus]MCR2056270.1 YcfL family protein [Campylobacter helveticus]MCR2059414.1 YcfL family protein [Campylobacter helveticus]
MKKYFLFFAALFLCACAPTQSNFEMNSANLSSNLPKSLIKQMKQRTNDNGFLEFELVLKSTFAKDVFYKVDWLDKDGFVLRNSVKEDYQLIRLPANQEVILRKLAFDKRAVDFRIDMKTKN